MKLALLKAIELAKTDLTAELVKEFTELQGVIGGLYARAQGLGERVALAIYEQYTPASTDGRHSGLVEGQLLGLADRIQTITAMFGNRHGADGIEGSVRAAPCGECHCEDSGRIGLPLLGMCWIRISGLCLRIQITRG